MKVCVIQPPYSTDYSLSDKYFGWELDILEKCDESMDIIVMPESCDVPCYARGNDEFYASVEKYNSAILKKASETAARCNALLFINALCETETGVRNTTYAFDTDGNIAGKYYKQHLVPNEVAVRKFDSAYTYEFSEPYVLELNGIRFGFLTCYDFYFYENFANMARQNLDIIIGCSHQRSDTHTALELITAFCAYNTNAYILRSSVSMGEDSEIGGCSMIVAPTGKIIANMKSNTGFVTANIDVKDKYYKPAGFGNPDAAHYEYIEKGRRPWKYRPAGSAIVLPDSIMSYPRVCAHRGFNTVAPENTMPAFGAAVAMGADEIEFDLWQTKDGEIVSAHDQNLERVSDGEGKITDLTYEELLKYDFGFKTGEEYTGIRILKFEEILKKFSCHTIMNIHIKSEDNTSRYDEKALEKIIALIDKYDCRAHVYFMTGNTALLGQCRDMAPDICRCAGAGDDPWEIVDNAIKYECKKVQLFKPYFNREMIDKAHEHGIKCNVFWSDDPEETKKFLEMGIDTILTNDYNRIAQVVKTK